MAKMNANELLRYLGLGAAAIVGPSLVSNFSQVNAWLVKVPMWNTSIGGVATVGGILLAGASILAVDKLIKK